MNHIFHVNYNKPGFEWGIHTWDIVELDENNRFVQSWGPHATRVEAFLAAERLTLTANQCRPSKCGTCTYACDELPPSPPDTEGDV